MKSNKLIRKVEGNIEQENDDNNSRFCSIKIIAETIKHQGRGNKRNINTLIKKNGKAGAITKGENTMIEGDYLLSYN